MAKVVIDEKLQKVIDDVHAVLRMADEFDLQSEVISTAMLYLKENPNCTIEDALKVGLSDWDV